MSLDPVAVALGDWKTIEEKTKGDVKTYLSNPQTDNSYSYAANNPLKYTDNSGEFIVAAAAIYAAIELTLSVMDAIDTIQTLNSDASAAEKTAAVGLFAAGLVGPGAGYNKAVKGVSKLTGEINNVSKKFAGQSVEVG